MTNSSRRLLLDLRIVSRATGSVDLKLPAGARPSDYRWDFNRYFAPQPSFAKDFSALNFSGWRQTTGFDSHSVALATRPTGMQVFVRPNKFKSGRAHIVVFNRVLRDEVLVNVSSILTPGASFEIRDAQNYFGDPVLAGTYKGGPVSLPLKRTRLSLPIGNVEREPRHTSPEFAVFVLHTGQSYLSSRPLKGREPGLAGFTG